MISPSSLSLHLYHISIYSFLLHVFLFLAGLPFSSSPSHYIPHLFSLISPFYFLSFTSPYFLSSLFYSPFPFPSSSVFPFLLLILLLFTLFLFYSFLPDFPFFIPSFLPYFPIPLTSLSPSLPSSLPSKQYFSLHITFPLPHFLFPLPFAPPLIFLFI